MAILLRNILLTLIFLFAAVSIPGAADMTAEQWTAYMTKNLPGFFCKEGQLYRDCYEVEQDTCKDAVTMAVQSCIDARSEQLPDIFTYDLSRQWSGVIEKCINEEYGEMFINQKKDLPECSQSGK